MSYCTATKLRVYLNNANVLSVATYLQYLCIYRHAYIFTYIMPLIFATIISLCTLTGGALVGQVFGVCLSRYAVLGDSPYSDGNIRKFW